VSHLSEDRQVRLAAPDDRSERRSELARKALRSVPAIRSGSGSVVDFSVVEPVET